MGDLHLLVKSGEGFTSEVNYVPRVSTCKKFLDKDSTIQLADIVVVITTSINLENASTKINRY